MSDKHYWFSLNISYAEYEQNYYGKGYMNVVVHTENGLRVSFPAGRLIRFVTRQGIRGRFRLTTDSEHRFKALDKVDL